MNPTVLKDILDPATGVELELHYLAVEFALPWHKRLSASILVVFKGVFCDSWSKIYHACNPSCNNLHVQLLLRPKET